MTDVERRIREALRREPAARHFADDWETFRRRVRGSARRRVLVPLSVIALAIVAGALVVPRLGDGERSFVDEGAPSSNVFVDDVAGYAFDVPPTWERDGLPGAPTTFAPPPTPPTPVPCGTELCFSGSTADVDPNAIELRITPRRTEDFDTVVQGYRARLSASGDSRFEEVEASVGGQPTRRFDSRSHLSEGALCVDSDCASWRRTRTFVDWQGGWVLDVNQYAAYGASHERWGAVAQAAVDSLRRVEAETAAEPNGVVARDIARDEATRMMIEFLEARVTGADAEDWLGPGVARAGTRWLNTFLSGCCASDAEYDLTWYAVRARDDRAASVSFTVVMYSGEDLFPPSEQRFVVAPGFNAEGERQRYVVVGVEFEGRRQ